SCNGSATSSFRRRRTSAPPGAVGQVCLSRRSSQSTSERMRLGFTRAVTGDGSKGDARRRRGHSGKVGREPGLGGQTSPEVICFTRHRPQARRYDAEALARRTSIIAQFLTDVASFLKLKNGRLTVNSVPGRPRLPLSTPLGTAFAASRSI